MMGRVMAVCSLFGQWCGGSAIFWIEFCSSVDRLMVFFIVGVRHRAVAAGRVVAVSVEVAADHGVVVAVVLAEEAHQDHGSY